MVWVTQRLIIVRRSQNFLPHPRPHFQVRKIQGGDNSFKACKMGLIRKTSSIERGFLADTKT